MDWLLRVSYAIHSIETIDHLALPLTKTLVRNLLKKAIGPPILWIKTLFSC